MKVLNGIFTGLLGMTVVGALSLGALAWISAFINGGWLSKSAIIALTITLIIVGIKEEYEEDDE